MRVANTVNKTGWAAPPTVLGACRQGDSAMPSRLWLLALPLLAGLALAAGDARAGLASSALAANSELDNTERNARDKGGGTVLPEDQKETSADIKITAAIRKALIKIKSLSLDAHNAKIITRDGVVTLRGPVENTAEKAKLQSIAQKTRGVKQVDNQLEPKTP